MGKPQPPDQERIELVINGDDPESHRQAQETARILSAPQLARTIQQRIDECRKQISAVVTAFNKATKVRLLNSVISPTHNCLYIGIRPSEIENMSLEIQLACAKALAAQTSTVYLDKDLGYYKDLDHTYWENIRGVFTVGGNKVIAKVLNDSLPTLMDQLKKHEGQLEDLVTIVKGK